MVVNVSIHRVITQLTDFKTGGWILMTHYQLEYDSSDRLKNSGEKWGAKDFTTEVEPRITQSIHEKVQ